MNAGQFLRPAIAGLCLLGLGGCDDGQNAGSNKFRNDYTEARTALETGHFDRANRIYARMLDQAGPLEPRIRLEYAHSLLRSGAYAEAAQQAQSLAQSQTGTARSAALAVLGVAQQELGLVALGDGDRTAARHYLTQAQGAIAQVLDADPGLDPLGALAGRQASIQVQLATLG